MASQVIRPEDLGQAIGSVDPIKISDASRLFTENNLPTSGVDYDTLRDVIIGGGFPGASGRSQSALLAALNGLGSGGEEELGGMEMGALSELLGFGRSSAELAALQKKISEQLFNESSPLRLGLIGAVERELGLPVSTSAPIAELALRRNINPEIEAGEAMIGRAREDILATTPSRGGQLNAQLGELPLERARLRSAIVGSAEEEANQRALSLATGIGLGTPSIALSGLGQASSSYGNAASAAGAAAQGYGAIQQRQIAERLGLASIAAQDRATAAQAEAGKKAGGGQAAGAGAGIAAAAIIAAACWVAAELYGPGTGRFWAVRTEIFSWESAAGRAFQWTYLRFGRRIAGLIRRRPIVRTGVKFVFDRILARAELRYA